MKKIIGVLRPFDMYQTFYIYQDGKEMEKIQTKMEDIFNIIFQLSQQYEIYEVDLSGSKSYVQGIIQQIQKKEKIKYNKNKLILNCI